MQQIALPTDPALAAFLQSVDVMPRTREAYASSIKLFLQYAQQQPLTPSLVRSWKEHLLERGVGDLSVGSYLSALRSWMAWGVSHGLIAGNVASEVKGPKAEKRFRRQPVNSHAQAILSIAGRDARTSLMVQLMLRGGLRTIELCRANVGDRQTREGRDVLNVQRKGRSSKDGFIVMHPALCEAWDAYIQERGPARPSDALFVGQRGSKAQQRISTRTVRNITSEVLKDAKVKEPRITAHSLRHTFAIAALRAGVPVADVQLAMGHASIDTTSLYLATEREQQRLQRPAELAITEY
jgi:site-specific recombinase XerD